MIENTYSGFLPRWSIVAITKMRPGISIWNKRFFLKKWCFMREIVNFLPGWRAGSWWTRRSRSRQFPNRKVFLKYNISWFVGNCCIPGWSRSTRLWPRPSWQTWRGWPWSWGRRRRGKRCRGASFDADAALKTKRRCCCCCCYCCCSPPSQSFRSQSIWSSWKQSCFQPAWLQESTDPPAVIPFNLWNSF